jgi:diacylglycerol kinase (ATP)
MAKDQSNVAFIINPNSGTSTKRHFEKLVNEYFDVPGREALIKYTKYPGHATKIARKLAKNGVGKVVAVGGDGTVNEVALGLLHSQTALGIIPMGSGNGLARHLKIPLRASKALERIKEGKIIDIDYGLINEDNPFFCTCGVGFDAHIGNKFSQTKRRGFSSYFKTTVSEFFKYRPKKYSITFDNGQKIKTKAFLITIANASQYGNNAYICPEADIQDGLLDICVVSPFPKFEAMDIGLRLFSKKIDKSRHVDVFRAKSITLKRKHKGVVHFDGEPCKMGKKLTIRVVPHGLKVVV